MKEEISFKEAIVTKVNYDRTNVEKEMENLKVRRAYVRDLAVKDAVNVAILHKRLIYNLLHMFNTFRKIFLKDFRHFSVTNNIILSMQ